MPISNALEKIKQQLLNSNELSLASILKRNLNSWNSYNYEKERYFLWDIFLFQKVTFNYFNFLVYLRRDSSRFEQSQFGFLQLAASGVGTSQVEEDLDVVKLEEFLQTIFVHLNRGHVLKITEENRFNTFSVTKWRSKAENSSICCKQLLQNRWLI